MSEMRDIPANVVAVGNPCRVLREIGEHDREYYARGRRMPEIVQREMNTTLIYSV